MASENIQKKRKEIDERLDKTLEQTSYDDIFMLVKDQINDFNFFLRNASIDRASTNVLQAIGTTIKFLLLQSIIKLDREIFAFNLKKVRVARELIESLKCHIALFYEFDDARIEESCWAMDSINSKMVQINFKLNPENSKDILIRMKVCAQKAKMKGWKGTLRIITRSEEPVILNV